MHNKRRHQILLMTPNDFHTPLDCSSLHLLFYIHSSFVYRNDVLDKSPFIRSSLSALFCTLSLVSIPECLFFHQVKPDDLCLVAPCQWLMFPWTVPPYIRFHVQSFLVTLRDGCLFFCCLKYNTHFTLCQPVFLFLFIFPLYFS